MPGGVDRRHLFSEYEIEKGREIHAGDEHGVVGATKNASRRHRAAASLQVGEDDLDTALLHALANELLDVLGAEAGHGDGYQLRAASGDHVDRGYQALRKVAVAGDDGAGRRLGSDRKSVV